MYHLHILHKDVIELELTGFLLRLFVFELRLENYCLVGLDEEVAEDADGLRLLEAGDHAGFVGGEWWGRGGGLLGLGLLWFFHYYNIPK